MSVVSAIGGKIAVNVAPADTALFQIQDAGDFEVEIDFPAGVVTVVEFKGALTVKGRLGSDC